MVSTIRSRISLQVLNQKGEIIRTNFSNYEMKTHNNVDNIPKYIFKFIYDKNLKIIKIKVFEITNSKWLFTYDAKTISDTFDSLNILQITNRDKSLLQKELKESKNDYEKFKETLLKIFLSNNLT